MARSSSSSVDLLWAGCSALRPCARSFGERHRCHIPCRHAADASAASVPTGHLRRCSPRLGRRSAGTRWGGTSNLSAPGFSSCAHRASGRSPGSVPPFSSGGRAMRPNGRGVDQKLGRWASGLRQSAKNPGPNAFLGPTHEAIVECLAWTIDILRRIGPAHSRFQHMHDTADHAAIIDPSLATRIRWEERFELSKLPCG
jgi:hypothetical protein